MVATKSFAYDIAVENEDGVTIYYSYINDGKELAVVQPTNDVIYRIPPSVMVDGIELPVTRIDDKAFRNSNVAILELPEGIKSIGESAFYGCSLLKTIKIPNSVEGKIADFCFSGCGTLTSIQIGENITEIGKYAFLDCKKLEKMILPDKVATIGDKAFSGCSSLTTISFGSGISSISGDGPFYNCPSLEKIIIRDLSAWCRVTNGSDNPVQNRYIYSDEDTQIKDLIIPNDVTCIAECAFLSCNSIETITVPNSVQIIDKELLLNYLNVCGLMT